MDSQSTSFTLQAKPGTDIWRKPPHTDVWNAPITRTSSGPLKKFRLARATFWGEWHEQYDQAGLLLVPRRAQSPGSGSGSGSEPPAKWIKAGLEFYNRTPQLSVVGCDRWADWSIAPLGETPDPNQGVTIEARRDGDEHGQSIWIWRVEHDDQGHVKEATPLREICWVLADEDDGDWTLEVSPLVARPEKGTDKELEVRFLEFKVEWMD
ncbi:hypothetical protein F4780DRAFT_489040 [Xylariomycetidae sp. FL0641]|nr:hypothetical protein F4780DRAFT_489040 [Xylariomycetidae sp. FL0641]